MEPEQDIIARDGHEKSPLETFNDIEQHWRGYNLAKWKYQELVQFRLDPNFQLEADKLKSWLGDEQEMSEALQVYRQTLQASLSEFERNSSTALTELTPDKRLSLRRIQVELEREAELQTIQKTKEHGYEQER